MHRHAGRDAIGARPRHVVDGARDITGSVDTGYGGHLCGISADNAAERPLVQGTAELLRYRAVQARARAEVERIHARRAPVAEFDRGDLGASAMHCPHWRWLNGDLTLLQLDKRRSIGLGSAIQIELGGSTACNCVRVWYVRSW